jgi:hypothetical protein
MALKTYYPVPVNYWPPKEEEAEGHRSCKQTHLYHSERVAKGHELIAA